MSYVVLDLETTGLNPQHDAIIEVAAIRVGAGGLATEFTDVVRPHVPVSEGAFAVNGISTAEAMARGKDPQDVFGRLHDFIGDLPIVAHNGISFDFPFLRNQMTRWGIRIGTNRLLDTKILVGPYLEIPKGKRKLAALCARLGITNAQAHHALSDTRATVELFRRIVAKEADFDALWATCDSLTWHDVGVDPQCYEAVYQSMDRGTDIQVEYEGKEKPASVRWIKPLRFAKDTAGNFIFIAWCYKDDMEKHFVVKRIKRVVQVGR